MPCPVLPCMAPEVPRQRSSMGSPTKAFVNDDVNGERSHSREIAKCSGPIGLVPF